MLRLILEDPDHRSDHDGHAVAEVGTTLVGVRASPQTLSLSANPQGEADAALVGSIVETQWRKIVDRTSPAGVTADLPGAFQGLSEDMRRACVLRCMDAPMTAPVFLPVQPAKGSPLRTVPFSTASFFDGADRPHVLIASHIGFLSAIISAFNSRLDLIQLRDLNRDPRQRDGVLAIFGGLNSQAIEVVRHGIPVPGFLRKDSAQHVL